MMYIWKGNEKELVNESIAQLKQTVSWDQTDISYFVRQMESWLAPSRYFGGTADPGSGFFCEYCPPKNADS